MDLWLSHYLVNIPIWIPGLILLIILIYRYGCQRFYIWETTGIPGPKPWPYLGTAWPMLVEGVRVFDQQCVRKYGNIVGLYEGSAPVLLVADPELLKYVFVKEFNNFMNRTASPLYTNKNNYIFRATLTRLMGEHWKHVRNQLTPTFSSAKLKHMMPQIRACANLLKDNLCKQTNGNGIDLKEYFGAFSMDVIARIAFGLDTDAQTDRSNAFLYYADKVFQSNQVNLKLISILLFPFLAKFPSFFGQNQFPSDAVEFFSKITLDAMNKRKEDGETRVDFLQLMLDHKIGEECNDETDYLLWNKQGLTHEEILAQSLLFFIAGYETTASTITFICYCLATNMDAQRKLQEEIDRVMEKQDQVTYDILSEVPYLDMCIQESLRLYPPVTRILRACNQDTRLDHIPVRRGTLIAIPVYTIHHSDKYWLDAERFIPERFMLNPRSASYTWLPFGVGPRNCIGRRLALVEVKVAVITLVRHLEFNVTADTEIPLKFKKSPILTPVKPISLAVKRREK